MTHRFPIKEIARQAGLGTATVDRVLNNRAHVSPQTRARVKAAVKELETQERQLAARGRRMFVDVIVEAPQRFSRQIKSACETVLPDHSEAVFRPRFLFQETMTESEIEDALSRIKKRSSHGVILKLRDIPTVRRLVDGLEEAGIATVTLVTDITGSRRSAYVGINNAAAGRTAAYLLANVMGPARGTILTTRSQEEFQGEAERYSNFRDLILALRPQNEILEIVGGAGLAGDTRRQLSEKLGGVDDIAAVYSMGGGNRTILEVLREERRSPQHFIAHDLDADNYQLLRDREISFILHHDLRRDIAGAFRALAARQGLIAPVQPIHFSDLQIITPHNLPARNCPA